MTKEEAIKIIEEAFEVWKSEFGEGDWEKEDEALEMAISALEKENIYDDKEHYVTISKALYDKLNVDACNDAISRADAIYHTQTSLTIYQACNKLKNLPSVHPTRKGHWETYYIEHTDGYIEEWHKCSECKQDSEYNWDFCHWCGADMRGDTE